MNKITLLLCCSLLLASCVSKQSVLVTNLTCEDRANPLGIDLAQPRLSWEIACQQRGTMQTACRILVASSLEKLQADEGDLWDSQMVASAASVLVPYGGKPLQSRTRCFWKVRVETNHGASSWSEPASWTMGLSPADWQARWTGYDKTFTGGSTRGEYNPTTAAITAEHNSGDVLKGKTRLAARYFRKEFDAAAQPLRATLYLSGLGLYKLCLNGQTIGRQELAPTPTDYSKVVKYNTFDVTDAIVKGRNAVAVTLGNGRFFTMREGQVDAIPTIRNFGFPKMILQLEMEYADGTRQTIVSDSTWKVTAAGPIRANNEYDGEDYDARREMPGWSSVGFDDNGWSHAEAVASPGGVLEAQLNPNITVMDELKPVSIKEVKPNVWVLDMGQNMVGWLQMKVKGKAGQTVQLRFAEAANADGSLYMPNLRGALVTDRYTLRGGATETFEPSFTYHGFRFVEITGYPAKPSVKDFVGKVLYDEMTATGSFATSDSTLNGVYRNAWWGIRGNYRGMPTDCPQRDERMGWLGDRAVGSHGESFLFNNHLLYSKWLDDIEQAQREDGCIPDVAPNYWAVYNDNMTWPGAYLIIANMLYEQFGDRQPIVRHYASMKRWMNHMRKAWLRDNIMTRDIYGDWCMPPEKPELIHSQDPARRTDGAVLGTAFYYRMLTLLHRFAVMQDKPDDAEAFAEEAAAVKTAYNDRFFNRATAQYSNNTVTANLLSLCYGMVPDGFQDRVFENIVQKTEKDFNGHISTGLVGCQWLMRGLSDYGRADLALRIATNRDYPSWGYMLAHGATTVWELWNGDTADPAMNSHNHVMLLGDLLVWYYEYLAGIRNAPGSAGFERIVMKPHTPAGLSFVKASYHSVHGLIKSAWQQQEGRFDWQLTVPCNTTATVYVPAADLATVTESGRAAKSAEGVRFLRMDGGYAVFEVGSGDYRWESAM